MRTTSPATIVKSIRANVPWPSHSGPGRNPRNTSRPSGSIGYSFDDEDNPAAMKRAHRFVAVPDNPTGIAA